MRARSIFLGFYLLAAAAPMPVFAAEDAAVEKVDAAHRLAQKIRMVEHILKSPDLAQRLAASKDSVAHELLARARRNFDEGEVYFENGQYLEAEAVLDYVLRDLSASAQLLSLPQRKQAEYQRFVAQLDAFVLPDWENLSDDDTRFVEQQLTRISGMRERADRHAEAGNFDEAIEVLDRAYGAKVTLFNQLQRETTVVYDLNFGTVQDEYRYLVGRTYHYLELVDYAVSQRAPDEGTQKLLDSYLYRSMVNLEKAENYETDGRFSDAIPVLEQSIAQLTAILKLLGVDI